MLISFDLMINISCLIFNLLYYYYPMRFYHFVTNTILLIHVYLESRIPLIFIDSHYYMVFCISYISSDINYIEQ